MTEKQKQFSNIGITFVTYFLALTLIVGVVYAFLSGTSTNFFGHGVVLLRLVFAGYFTWRFTFKIFK